MNLSDEHRRSRDKAVVSGGVQVKPIRFQILSFGLRLMLVIGLARSGIGVPGFSFPR